MRRVVMAGLLLLAPSRVPSVPVDPATDFVRVRAFITTTSSSLDVRVEGAEWANAVSRDSSVRVITDGAVAHVTRKTTGQVDIPLDIILASVHAGSTITWTIAPVSEGASTLEIYNANAAAPRIVDRFDAGSRTAQFRTAADLLRDGGPLPAIKPVKEHLVVAFFYPWWTLDTWSSSAQMYDQPVPEYSSDNPADLQRLMTTAKNAGLDAFVMSWSGKAFNGELDHRRMLRCLDAANAVGFKMAALFETTAANTQHRDGEADADTVLQWLTDVVDDYASNGAYLRVEGRPVVMAYAAQRLTQAGWTDALRRLRASGRDVLLIGEGSNNTRLGAFDGQFFYASNVQPGDAIDAWDRAQSLSVRTYHLLPGDNVGRRVWVATVSPGYDDTHLQDGRVARVTDRAGGRYYTTQWRAAFASSADWIAITSWNEYLENTEIEPTRLYGDFYLSLTKGWRAAYLQLNAVAIPRTR